MSSTALAPAKQSFKLFGLPAEIRNNIFGRLATVTDRKGELIVLDIKKHRLYSGMFGFNATLASKQMRHEYTSLYYGTNFFSFAAFCRAVLVLNHGGKQVQTVQDPWLWAWSETAPLVMYSGFQSMGAQLSFAIRLPPVAVRPMIKHIQLVLTVPLSGGPHDRPMWSSLHSGNYHDGRNDWLYPVRELNTLGKCNLDCLEVKVRFSASVGRYRQPENDYSANHEVGLRTWVGQQCKHKAMSSIDAKSVNWVYEEFDA
ncbi:hypothetical protein LTR85_009033 [Meristemomyces frigidus]|nr:hypothetical protein LTR85_009033 [Meristemomyces frigidus]